MVPLYYHRVTEGNTVMPVPFKAEPRYTFPMEFDRYKALTSEALFQVSGGNEPKSMIAAAVNTIREGFEDQMQPYDTARCILDDAMTGQVW